MFFSFRDNPKLQQFGLCYCALDSEDLGIKFAPHPLNSPGMHPIEGSFGRLETLLEEYSTRCMQLARRLVDKRRSTRTPLVFDRNNADRLQIVNTSPCLIGHSRLSN